MVRKAEGGKVAVDVSNLLFSLPYFVADGDGEVVVIVDGGSGGGGNANTKCPHCGLTISVVGLGPTHYPEAERQGVVNPFLGVIIFALAVSRLSLQQAVRSVVLCCGHVNQLEVEE